MPSCCEAWDCRICVHACLLKSVADAAIAGTCSGHPGPRCLVAAADAPTLPAVRHDEGHKEGGLSVAYPKSSAAGAVRLSNLTRQSHQGKDVLPASSRLLHKLSPTPSISSASSTLLLKTLQQRKVSCGSCTEVQNAAARGAHGPAMQGQGDRCRSCARGQEQKQPRKTASPSKEQPKSRSQGWWAPCAGVSSGLG